MLNKFTNSEAAQDAANGLQNAIENTPTELRAILFALAAALSGAAFGAKVHTEINPTPDASPSSASTSLEESPAPNSPETAPDASSANLENRGSSRRLANIKGGEETLQAMGTVGLHFNKTYLGKPITIPIGFNEYVQLEAFHDRLSHTESANEKLALIENAIDQWLQIKSKALVTLLTLNLLENLAPSAGKTALLSTLATEKTWNQETLSALVQLVAENPKSIERTMATLENQFTQMNKSIAITPHISEQPNR